jgi:DNA-binding NarL/FixJ family response regulator
MYADLEERAEPLFSGEEWKAICRQLRLTDRQAQIILLILEGQCDKQIAAALGICISTVRSHLKGIFNKLQIQARNELVLKIFRQYLKNLRQSGYPHS